MAKKKKATAKPTKSTKKGAAKKSAKPAKKAAKKSAKPAKKAAKPKSKAKPAKKQPAKKPAKSTEHPQLAIEFEDEGPTFPGGAPGSNGNGHAKANGVDLHAEILAMARTLYGNKPDAELLAFDPNDVDALDPSIFYELIQERYGVEGDEANSYFAGFGGPIKSLIAFVIARWDGKTNNPVEMPPQDYLEEVVHGDK